MDVKRKLLRKVTLRKVLRKIVGPVYNTETRTFERRHNNDLQNMYRKAEAR